MNYRKPKQNKTKIHSESVSSADLGYTETESEREDLEDSKDEENQNKNEEKRSEKPLRISGRDQPDQSVSMEAETLRELQEDIAYIPSKQPVHWSTHPFQKQSAYEGQLLPMVMTLKT